jgi:hypothetical protein
MDLSFGSPDFSALDVSSRGARERTNLEILRVRMAISTSAAPTLPFKLNNPNDKSLGHSAD